MPNRSCRPPSRPHCRDRLVSPPKSYQCSNYCMLSLTRTVFWSHECAHRGWDDACELPRWPASRLRPRARQRITLAAASIASVPITWSRSFHLFLLLRLNRPPLWSVQVSDQRLAGCARALLPRLCSPLREGAADDDWQPAAAGHRRDEEGTYSHLFHRPALCRSHLRGE